MRKIGIVIMIFGLLSLILGILINGDISGSLGSGLFAMIGCILVFCAKYRKNQQIRIGKDYHEVGWGKVICYTIIGIFLIGSVAILLFRIQENSIEGVIKKANRDCPIPIAGGLGELHSIEAINDMLVYTIFYDEYSCIIRGNIPKYIILDYAYILNGQNDNGNLIMKYIKDNNYGISYKFITQSGEKHLITLSNKDLGTYLNMKKSPATAAEEIIKWQIDFEQEKLPYEIDKSLILTEIFNNESNLVFKVIVEDNNLTIPYIEECNSADYRNLILQQLYSEPTWRGNLELFTIGKINLIYRYVNNNATDSCDIFISHEEISKVTEIPEILGIN